LRRVSSTKKTRTQEGLRLVYRRLPGLSTRATQCVVELAEQGTLQEMGRDDRQASGAVDSAGAAAVPVLAAEKPDVRRAGRRLRRRTDHGMGVRPHDDGIPRRRAGLRRRGRRRLGGREGLLFDGTLVPTFNWGHRRDLYSGKRRRYGVNVQVLADIHGRVEGVSRAFPGSWHDKHCFDEAGIEAVLAGGGGGVGDSGYQGVDAVTPIKKGPGGKLADAEKKFNTALASVRVGAEWVIAHVKNWRIMTSRYRRDVNERLDNVILTTAGLQALNERFSDRKLAC
jgi:hypothetical protein